MVLQRDSQFVFSCKWRLIWINFLLRERTIWKIIFCNCSHVFPLILLYGTANNCKNCASNLCVRRGIDRGQLTGAVFIEINKFSNRFSTVHLMCFIYSVVPPIYLLCVNWTVNNWIVCFQSVCVIDRTNEFTGIDTASSLIEPVCSLVHLLNDDCNTILIAYICISIYLYVWKDSDCG